jgi:hypothetical protein
MLRHIKYSDAERKLAGLAREAAMNRDVLYHGTRYAQSILKMGVLFHSRTGHVCLTRSAEVAAYWALLERDDDEGRGSIFILDRHSLERRYKIDANPEVYWHSKTRFHDEAEEEILDNVVDVGNHLIGVVSGPTIRRSQRTKTLNRRLKNEIEVRLLELLPPPPKSARKTIAEIPAGLRYRGKNLSGTVRCYLATHKSRFTA